MPSSVQKSFKKFTYFFTDQIDISACIIQCNIISSPVRVSIIKQFLEIVCNSRKLFYQSSFQARVKAVFSTSTVFTSRRKTGSGLFVWDSMEGFFKLCDPNDRDLG